MKNNNKITETVIFILAFIFIQIIQLNKSFQDLFTQYLSKNKDRSKQETIESIRVILTLSGVNAAISKSSGCGMAADCIGC
ncbi:MAG: hypothetical protein ABH952_05800 [Candidatus Omnitrophota bacterium]